MWLLEEEEEKEDRNRIHTHIAVLLTYSVISCSQLFLLTIQAACSLHDEVKILFFLRQQEETGFSFPIPSSVLFPPVQPGSRGLTGAPSSSLAEAA